MKYYTYIFISMIFIACGEDTRVIIAYKYQFHNNSNAEIIITAKDYYGLIPEQITLKPGEKFEWKNTNNDTEFSPLTIIGDFIVTFDNEITISYPGKLRSPFDPKNYQLINLDKTNILAIFEFTNNDYENI